MIVFLDCPSNYWRNMSDVSEENKTTLRISELDRLSLELAKSNRRLALANAEKALAQNETADVSYKYLVLQLYMKYGLTEVDAINEAGEILKGGALAQKQ